MENSLSIYILMTAEKMNNRYQILNKGRCTKGHCRSNPKNLPEYKSTAREVKNINKILETC
jgi:hypothetical protein